MLALSRHLFIDRFELFPQQRDTLTDHTLIGFYLRLTHTAVRASTASLPIQVRPHTGQTRQHILQMGHLHLRLRIRGLRTLQEDLQNQYRSINNAHIRLTFVIQRFLNITYLPRTQLVIKDNYVNRMMLLDILIDLFEFAFAYVCRCNGQVQTLREPLHRHDAVCISKKRQLIQVLLGPVLRLVGCNQSNQNGMLNIWFYFYHIFVGAKVQQILHICKRLGIFF